MQPGMLEDKFRWLRSKPLPRTRRRQKSSVPIFDLGSLLV
jgi:hypothetical protein